MIYLMRHGEIETPGPRRFIGQIDYPLSDRGRDQAENWKTALAGKGIASIFCSDLIRSSETGAIISPGLGLQPTVDSRLREIHLGMWEGQSMQEIRTRFPDVWKERGRSIDTFRTPRGESFNDLYHRVVPAFRAMTQSAGRHILIIGHAGVNRMILCSVLGVPVGDLFSIGQDYGALSLIDNSEADYKAVCINVGPAYLYET